MKITEVKSAFVNEKLKSPFGFKGGYLTELRQVVCGVKTEKAFGVGVGVQSVLWSDEKLFISNTENQGNAYMYAVTEYALNLLRGREGETPMELTDAIFPQTLSYARTLTNVRENLRETFVRNALVAVDNALWVAYAKEMGTEDFLEVVPKEYSVCLAQKHDKLCNVPLISYGVSKEEIKRLLDFGTVLLKIKIGFDDNGKMDKSQMLEWDKARLKEVHSVAEGYKTEYTESGKILYYLDANGKYDSADRVKEFISYAKEIGAYDSIVLFEEPFPEEEAISVKGIKMRFAADESVHSVSDVEKRIALGYTAVTLKPIAKTLTETLKILKKAKENDVLCFCADLTVNPLLVEWNKNVAARINKLPEMKIGILESNGEQNYERWKYLYSASPMGNKDFAVCKNGLYNLNKEFFSCSGGIFRDSEYYLKLLK